MLPCTHPANLHVEHLHGIDLPICFRVWRGRHMRVAGRNSAWVRAARPVTAEFQVQGKPHPPEMPGWAIGAERVGPPGCAPGRWVRRVAGDVGRHVAMPREEV